MATIQSPTESAAAVSYVNQHKDVREDRRASIHACRKQGYVELRRHKLRISRACAFKNLFAQALNHSAAPPLPEKSVGLFGGPVIMCRPSQGYEVNNNYNVLNGTDESVPYGVRFKQRSAGCGDYTIADGVGNRNYSLKTFYYGIEIKIHIWYSKDATQLYIDLITGLRSDKKRMLLF